MFGVVGNLSMNRGATHWFHIIWSYGGEVIKYYTIFIMIIQLNQNKKV